MSEPEKGTDGTWKIPGFLSRISEVMGGGQIGNAVLAAGGAMVGAGIATTVMNYGVQAAAVAYGDLHPVNTPVLVAQGKGMSIGNLG